MAKKEEKKASVDERLRGLWVAAGYRAEDYESEALNMSVPEFALVVDAGLLRQARRAPAREDAR